MRKLKFRTWSKAFNRFNYLEWTGSHFIQLNYYNNSIENEVFEIQQFTSLLDKNGKEIYEGDIVKQQYDDNDNPQSMVEDLRWSSKTWTVIWSETTHRFNLTENKYKYHGNPPLSNLPHGNQTRDIEVVGNIFENPELL